MRCFTDDELFDFESEARGIGFNDCKFAVVAFLRLNGEGNLADMMENHLVFNKNIPLRGEQ